MKRPASIYITSVLVTQTLQYLQASGTRGTEGIVLWLGRRVNDRIEVVSAYEPEHEAARDFFHISAAGMNSLMERLAATGTFVAAQVHSHPQDAFHSLADDRWAIVRHLNAISLVVPRFALSSSAQTFLADTVGFSLSTANHWVELDPSDLLELVKII